MSQPSVRAATADVVLVLAIIAPPCSLLMSPTNLLGQAAAAVITALAAITGFGVCVALIVRRPTAEVADTWGVGLGCFLAGASALAALHAFSSPMQVAVLTAGVVLHVIAMVMYRGRIVAAIAGRLGGASAAGVAVAALVVAITAIHVMGASASYFRSPFDDDGNWVAAAKRLRDTGGFGDFIGYARMNQLGGTVVATGLVATVDEVRASWLVEGIGFIVTIAGLAATALPRRGEPTVDGRLRQGAFVFLILFLALSAKAQAEKELSAFWIPTALVITTYRIVAIKTPWTRARSLELGLVLGGLCTLRLELVPFALAVVVVTLRDREGRVSLDRLLVTGSVMIVATAPLAIDRLLEGRSPSLALGKLAILGTMLMVAAFADARGSRRPLPRMVWAVAIGTAATYVGPTVAGAYSRAFSWPTMFGLAFLATAELARAQWAGAAAPRFRQLPATVLVVIGVLSIIRAQDTTIRWNWRERTERWFHDARLGATMPRLGGREPYWELARAVPPGTAVLAWIDRPELLDFTAHRYFDLRVPRHARSLRRFSWEAPEAPLARIRKATGARYLLLQTDHLRDKRAKDSTFYAIWCAPGRPDAKHSAYNGRPVACADPLERIRLRNHVVASIDNVYLIDLDREATAVSNR